MGSAALSTVVERSQVSTHMSIDYLAPVMLGDTALVDANVLQKGSRTGVIEVRTGCRRCTGVQKGRPMTYTTLGTGAVPPTHAASFT